MEPYILIIGQDQQVIDILVDELKRFGRHVVGTNDKSRVQDLLQNDNVDLVVMGAGLPDDVREEMSQFIHQIKPDLPVHLILRTPQSHPAGMIGFVNDTAVSYKIMEVLGQHPHT